VAVILEIVHPNGTRSWQRLDTLPLTVGRGLRNDLILDDPYVDAQHARIALDETGLLHIEDLGTVNGMVSNEARTRTAVPLHPGVDVRLGRTTLRFRDLDESVSPAMIDDRAAAVPAIQIAGAHSMPPARPAGWMPPAWVSRAIVAAAPLLFALAAWLGTADRSSGFEVLSGAVGFVVLATLWAGVWAMVSRASVHRFNYLGHVAVVSAIAIAGLGWSAAEEWLAFFLPDAAVVDVMSTIVGIALLCMLLAGHLSLSSPMSRQRRWRLSAIIAASTIAATALVGVVMGDSYSDIASFSGVVKPVAPNWIPTQTLGEFGSVMRELKDEVDKTASEAGEATDAPINALGRVDTTTKE
jgi:pSer/pThr/pTyr-binding forkhead associated (FHA) protein